MESSEPLECLLRNLILSLIALSVVLGDKGARNLGFEVFKLVDSLASSLASKGASLTF